MKKTYEVFKWSAPILNTMMFAYFYFLESVTQALHAFAVGAGVIFIVSVAFSILEKYVLNKQRLEDNPL